MIRIVGAGMAGLLAANMLRHKSPLVLEQQSSLPNNHSAVLRFRSHIVGDVTGTEFRKVDIIKATLPWKNAIADSMAYADKNTGTLRSDRSLPSDPIRAERYIAPPNFISQLAYNSDIRYSFNNAFDLSVKGEPIISTIPMPALMKILGYPEAPLGLFKSNQSTNVIAKVKDCDAYVSLYVPDPSFTFSRVSITGDEIVAECPFGATENDVFTAAHLLGIHRQRLSDVKMKEQVYAKIQPVSEEVRKRFIAWASDEYNVYSLGRYACWRPSTLLDDLVQDIRHIERWINQGGHYARKLHHNRKVS